MLQLRPSQIRALEEDASRRFTTKMCSHIFERFPNKAANWDESTLRVFVDAGIREAESYGILDRNDIRRYLEYYFEFNGKFGTRPESLWAQPILESDACGTTRMDRIDDQALALAIKESRK